MDDNVAVVLMELKQQIGGLIEKTDLILSQVTKTNGRVTNCEDRLDKLERKKDRTEGADGVKKKEFRYGIYVLSAAGGGIASQLLGIAAKFFKIVK